MVSWKSSVSHTERREEHMLSFTLEICSLICDDAIIRPVQYGRSVIRCDINKMVKSKDQIWMERLPSPLSLAVNAGLSQAAMNFVRNYKDSPCLSAAPKTKTVAKKKKNPNWKQIC